MSGGDLFQFRGGGRTRAARHTWIWMDSISSSTCRGCGADVVFAQNARTSKWMPFSGAKLTPRQTEMRQTKPGTYRQVGEVPLALAHFGTCPAARQFSSKGRR